MKFFNNYNKKDKCRWMGFNIFKTTFGMGTSFGLPFWLLPVFTLIFNNKEIKNNVKCLFDLSFGWGLFCLRFRIVR